MGTVRTPGNNPYVKKDLPTNNMDSKVFISMRELSQILETAGNDSHQVKTILTAVEGLSTSPEIIDEPTSQELQKDVLCEIPKENDTLGITFEWEKPEIKELFTCKLTDPTYAQTTAQLEEEDLYDIEKEYEYQDYIRKWFYEVTRT